MAQEWIPIALCTSGGIIGWVIVYIIQFYQYAWFLLSGMSYVYRKLWIYFLVIYGYLEELFFNWMLSHEFPEPRPPCSLIQDPLFESKRQRGMPCLEVQLAFALSTFVVVNLAFSKAWPPRYTLFTVIALPMTVAASLWITNNNTGAQIFIGALIGMFNALRRVMFYQFFAKDALLILINKVKFVQWFAPMNEYGV